MQALLELCRRQTRQTEAFERARPAAQIAPQKATIDGQQAMRDRRIDAGVTCHRGEKSQPQFSVFCDVAVAVKIDLLAPVARLDELSVRIAIHPLIVVVMVGQWIVGAAVAQRLTHCDAFLIQPVGHVAHSTLRAFVVDVPALEVL